MGYELDTMRSEVALLREKVAALERASEKTALTERLTKIDLAWLKGIAFFLAFCVIFLLPLKSH